jgi:AP2-like factor (euAP2 lineage)
MKVSEEKRKIMSERIKGNTYGLGIKGKNGIDTSSKYVGVCYARNESKWVARAGRKGHIGYFYTEIEAAYAYNQYVINKYGDKAKLNIIDKLELEKAIKESSMIIEKRIRTNEMKEHQSNILQGKRRIDSNKYVGVSWNKIKKKWTANTTYKQKYIYIGDYENEEDAAKAYDLKVLELFGPDAKTNFLKEK